MIAMKKEELRLKEEVKLEFLISELTSIIFDVKQEGIERDDNGRITSKPDRNSALKALDMLAKLGGYYQQKIDMTTNGENINQFTIKIIPPNNYEEDNVQDEEC